jgi:energy-coupling factor transport system permease protein
MPAIYLYLKLFNFDIFLLKNFFTVNVKLLNIILLNNLLFFGISANHLAAAINSIVTPLKYFGLDKTEISVLCIIVLRFVPIILNEIQNIFKAFKCRGIKFKILNFRQNFELLTALLTTLFIFLFKKAEELSIAMESRCYSLKDSLIFQKKLKFSKTDVLILIFAIFFLVGVILAAIFQII